MLIWFGVGRWLADLSSLSTPSLPLSCRLCLAEVSPSAVTYSNKSRVLPVRATLPLRPGEALLQVAWQSLMPAGAEAGSFHSSCEGAGSAAAACAALLTSQRVLIVNELLSVVASAAIPSDTGLPVSCLWMGPALLVSTSTGQVSRAGRPLQCEVASVFELPAGLAGGTREFLTVCRCGSPYSAGAASVLGWQAGAPVQPAQRRRAGAAGSPGRPAADCHQGQCGRWAAGPCLTGMHWACTGQPGASAPASYWYMSICRLRPCSRLSRPCTRRPCRGRRARHQRAAAAAAGLGLAGDAPPGARWLRPRAPGAAHPGQLI